jgi:hypothetical protein
MSTRPLRSLSSSASHSFHAECSSSISAVLLLVEHRASLLKFAQQVDLLRPDAACSRALFELHVEFKNLFQQVGRNDLFLGLSPLARAASVAALDWSSKFTPSRLSRYSVRAIGIAQRAIGVVEQRSHLQAPVLLAVAGQGVGVGMQLAAQRIEVALELRQVDVELARAFQRT